MSLIADAFVGFKKMTVTRASDGQGGQSETWAEGASFTGALAFSADKEYSIADKGKVGSEYVLTTAKNTGLAYHDVVKRVSDGKLFRVITDSADRQAPSLNFIGSYEQVKVEEWAT